MNCYKYVVFTNAVPGRDDEYNRWYDEQHLGDVLAFPGFFRAERFRLIPAGGQDQEFGYLAIYSFESNDGGATIAALLEAGAAGGMQISDALAPGARTILYRRLAGGRTELDAASSRFKYLAFTNPVDGREDEFNQWYADVHVGEVLRLDGFVSADRLRMEPADRTDAQHRYLAIYDLETNDPGATLAAIADRFASGGFTMSPAISMDGVASLGERIADLSVD